MNLKRIAFVSLASLASACGGSSTPSSPAPVSAPAAAATNYNGQYRITSCGSLCGWVGPSWPFSLTISGTNDAPTAVIRTEPWGLEATLTGRRQVDGLFVFSGTSGGASSTMTATFDVVVREDPDRGVTGTFSYAVTRLSAPPMTVTGEILSATRGEAAPIGQDFSGTWAGGGREERLCTSDWGCGDPTFGLLVAKQGSGYSAIAQIRTRGAQRLSVPVTGTQVGSSLTLRGSVPKAPGQLLDIGHEITRLALRILPSGEMVGDFELVQYESSYSTTFRGALLGGSRRSNLVAGRLTGSWYGWMLHESCSGDCSLLHATAIPVTLTESGGNVEGRYANQFPLSGSGGGANLVIQGGNTTPGCLGKSGTVCSEDLRIVVTGIDDWGVMSGTASHTWNRKYERYTKSGRLWNFTRQIQ